MKKALSAAMAAGMTAVMLAGCGSSASSAAESTAPAESTSAAASTEAAAESVVSAPTELSFVFADGDDNFKTEMNKIVDNFNAANPDITITIEPGDGGSYSEFLKTKDSVGEFPDMMEMRDTAMYVRAGKVAPLSDDIKALFTSTVEFDGVTYTAPMSGANTMLMDEPTNHLDMESITALNNSLIKYPGVLLFTSQDHQFVQTVANRIMELTPGGLIDKQCTYDEYLENDEMARKRQILNMEAEADD